MEALCPGTPHRKHTRQTDPCPLDRSPTLSADQPVAVDRPRMDEPTDDVLAAWNLTRQQWRDSNGRPFG